LERKPIGADPQKKSSKGKLMNWKTQMQAMVHQLKDSKFASIESKLVPRNLDPGLHLKRALVYPFQSL
jgi:hypothetical protein